MPYQYHCSRCNKALPSSAVYCRRCGFALVELDLARAAAEARPAAKRPSSGGNGQSILIIVGVAAILFIVIFSMATSRSAAPPAATISTPDNGVTFVPSIPDTPTPTLPAPIIQPQTVYVPVPSAPFPQNPAFPQVPTRTSKLRGIPGSPAIHDPVFQGAPPPGLQRTWSGGREIYVDPRTGQRYAAE